MIQRKHLIIGGAILLLLIGLGVYAEIRQGQKEEAAQQAENKQAQNDSNSDTTSDDEEIDESLAEFGSDTHMDEAAPIVLNNEEITQVKITRDYEPLAEKAAREFLYQFTKETTKARQDRLRAVFTSNSPAIRMPVPKVDLSNSADITANPIIMNSSWGLVNDDLVVTVAFRVISRSNVAPREEVSSVYQAYDVTFARQNGEYMPHSIKFSDKPVIVSN